MRDIVKAFRRPPAVRLSDRNGGFPRLSDGVAHGYRAFPQPVHFQQLMRTMKRSAAGAFSAPAAIS